MIRWDATGLVIALGLTFMPLSPALAHERKEVAGLSVLFGAEPEPALTEEVEWLRWRFQAGGNEQPFSDVEQAQAMVTRNGKQFGPFEARAVRGQAGLLQTMHIFGYDEPPQGAVPSGISPADRVNAGLRELRTGSCDK